MKTIFSINDTAENKISFYFLALFLVLLPYDFFYSELVLAGFALHTFIHARKMDWKNILRPQVLVLTALFFLNLLAITYSTNKQAGFNLSVRQLAIFLFPVLFSIMHIDLHRHGRKLICIFGFSCTVTVTYLYYDACRTIAVFKLPLSSLFTANFMNHNFSLPIGIHATYLSLYIAFAIIAFLVLLLQGTAGKQKWLFITAAIILVIGLIQLSSRAVFISFLIIVNIILPFILFSGKKRMVFCLLAVLASALVILLINKVPSFKTRYVSELKTDLTDKVTIIENTEPRLARWEAILELIKQSPFIGYGNGSENELLQDKYFEKRLYISYLNEFNTHNQYLAALLKTGIAGLLLFLFTIFYGYSTAFKRRDLLFVSFMVMVSVVSLSENLLDLNKGIFFYGFFFSMLLLFPGATMFKKVPVTVTEATRA